MSTEVGSALQRAQAESMVQELAPVGLFGDTAPEAIVQKATAVSNALASVIEEKKLYVKISQRKHVNVEGWTLLGTMLGVFPVVAWSREVIDEDGNIVGWEARVEARTLQGALVGAAEAMCMRAEGVWAKRPDYAIRSMAQTRATSKALRLPLGFVMTLAGYEATPEEEMVAVLGTVDAVSEPRAPQEIIDLLITLLPRLERFDPERWNLDSILATATRVFGHPVERLADLTISEAGRVLEGAQKALQELEDTYGREQIFGPGEGDKEATQS